MRRSSGFGLRVLIGAMLSLVVVMGVSACSLIPLPQPASSQSGNSQSDGSSGSGASGSVPTGTKGAADFSAGYLETGSGSTVIDTFIDPLCPYCGQFERANGSWIRDQVNGGQLTLRIHPMVFLDASSNGSKYSSRAASALTCVAADSPSATLKYLAALYSNQPEEGSTGLSDSELNSLASQSGASGVSSCINGGNYVAWVQSVNDKAIKGPLDIHGSTLTAIQGTPTVLVNGKQYQGSLTSASDFENFVSAQKS
jgi:protein-disulfide isomerase